MPALQFFALAKCLFYQHELTTQSQHLCVGLIIFLCTLIPDFHRPHFQLSFVKQECDAKDLGDSKQKFEFPEKIKEGIEISFYCNWDHCNTKGEIRDILKNNATETIKAMEKANGGAYGGAAQTTLAVATILFSMAMARLAR